VRRDDPPGPHEESRRAGCDHSQTPLTRTVRSSAGGSQDVAVAATCTHPASVTF